MRICSVAPDGLGIAALHVGALPTGSTSLPLFLTMEICHPLRSCSCLGFSDIRVSLIFIGFSPGNKPNTRCGRVAQVCNDRAVPGSRNR